MRKLESCIGIEPFTVKVDDSPRLRELMERARGFRGLDFSVNLDSTKALIHEAIPINAYEKWIAENDQEAKDVVLSQHPLSQAIESGMGCCRYQGALFFVLGHEAWLGDHHFLQAAPVNNRVNTVFNEVVNVDIKHVVSIFTESLKDKSHDYSRENPKVFDQAYVTMPGRKMYSYHRTSEGLILVESIGQHVSF